VPLFSPEQHDARRRVKARKGPYYVRSFLELARQLEQPRDIVSLVLGSTRELRFTSGLVFRIQGRLDLLLLKETLCDDVYRLEELADARLIVDVGAGIGDFAVAAARRFPACRVLAFEPDAVRFAMLTENAVASGAVIESHRVAIGSRSTYVLSGKGARASTVAREDAEGSSVPGRRLADFIDDDTVDLLKIDCEGAELDILQSLSPEGLRRVARVALEYHNFDGERSDVLVASHLTDSRFRVSIHPDRYDPTLGYVYARRE
jgi:FkbM family methyltransferase